MTGSIKKKSIQHGGWRRKNANFKQNAFISLYLRIVIEQDALCHLFCLFCGDMQDLCTQMQDHRMHNWDKEKGTTPGPVERKKEVVDFSKQGGFEKLWANGKNTNLAKHNY